MPFGLLSQVCHTSCSSSSFLTAASVSFTQLRSFLLSYPFHFTTFVAMHLLEAGHTLSSHNPNHISMHQSFRKPSLQYSLGFILLHFIIHSLSSIQSTRCLLLLCSPCGHCLRYGVYLSQHQFLYGEAICHVTPLHCASIMPKVILLSAPVSGTRSHIRSCLPPVPLGSQLSFCVDKCATPAMLLFCRRRYYLFYTI
jgi:hypothetical protein